MVYALVRKAVSLGVIEKEKADIYEYGLENFLYNFITWCAFLLAGALIDAFWYMLLFMLIHIPLRIHAGGVHCATRMRCFLVSSITTVIIFSIPAFFTPVQLAIGMLVAITPNVLLIKLLAPVEDLRKTLNKKEKAHYSKISFSIAFATSVLVIVLCILQLYQAAYYAGVALTLVSIQLACGVVKNKLESKSA